MKEFNRESFSESLTNFIQENGLQLHRVAEAIGCSEATINRLLEKRTLPSAEMMQQLELMFQFGFDKYSNFSNTQKKKLSDMLGSVGGGAFGVASIPFIISSAGSVSGLCAAGITSGLAALGGTMVGGIMIAATIPVAVGVAGVATVHGIKSISANRILKKVDVDKRWEHPRNDLPPNHR
jgi:hypothetical protein